MTGTMRLFLPLTLLFALPVQLLAGAAMAGERARLYLPADVAAERTLQLSPGSGVFPGYKKPRLVSPYAPAGIILSGKVPVGVQAERGGTRPVGSFDDGRGGPPAAVAKD